MSSGYAGETFLGKKVVRIGDPEVFRREDTMRAEARSALEAESESQAQELIELFDRWADVYDSDEAAVAAIEERVRHIGQQLCASGGSDRMKLVAFRVEVLNEGKPMRRTVNADVSHLEMKWRGICGWY